MPNFKEIMSYSPQNKNIFNELAKLRTKQMIVPYIGAGMSAFEFPTWDKLIKEQYEIYFHKPKPKDLGNIDAAEEIENELEKRGKDFSQDICNTMGGKYTKEKWAEVLKRAEDESISFIPKLFFGPIVTTNFDQIIEKIHSNVLHLAFPNHIEELKKNVEETIDKRKRILYKIHGCVSSPKDTVITKKKYNEVYHPDTELVKSLKKFFQGFNFLFLGCSLTEEDYPIDLLLRLQEKSGMPHYAIIECEEEKIKSRQEKLEAKNIFPIFYKKGEHESVKIILSELFKETQTKELLFKVPKYDTPFINRTNNIINKITDNLKIAECSLLILNGNAGVGKTRIMSEYAHTMGKKYDYIFWFNAISDDYVKEEIRQFVVGNTPISKDENNPEIIAREFRNWMETNNNYLFLLDNVDYLEAIKPFLDIDRTLAGTHHILITSRLNEDIFPDISTIPIDVFEKEDARSFFKGYTGFEPDEYTDKIAYVLGYLPLALEQAAAYIKTQNEFYKEYFELLEKEPLKKLGEKHPEPGAIPVRATWNITMQRIKSVSAKELLNLCAFFAPDDIIDYWFVRESGVLPQSLQDVVKDEIKFNDIKTELKKYSLVKITDSDNGYYQKISMHRLLQDVVKESLGNEQKKWLAHCLDLMYNITNWNEHIKESVDSFKREAPHAIAVAEKSSAVFNEDEKRIDNVAEIFFIVSSFYAKLSYLSLSLSCCNKGIEIMERISLKEHWAYNSLVTAYTHRGSIYNSMADYGKAIEDHSRSIKIGEDLLAKDEFVFENGLATAYMNRGISYGNLKKHDKALQDKNKAIEIFERLHKEGKLNDENNLASSYMNRGTTYELMTNHKKSLADFNKSIKIYEDMKRKGRIINENNLATTYTNMSLIRSKILIEKNKDSLSKAEEAAFNKTATIAQLNYRKKQIDGGKK